MPVDADTLAELKREYQLELRRADPAYGKASERLENMTLGELAKLRARVSVASRQEDKVAALEQVFPGTVEIDDVGDITVGGRKWDPGDAKERGSRSWLTEFVADIADMAGPALEVVPGGASALQGAAIGAGVGGLPGAIIGAGFGGFAGGAAGNVVRQGTEEVISGGRTLDRSALSRIREMKNAGLVEGFGNAAGEGIGMGIRAAGRAIHAATPTGQMQRFMASELERGVPSAIQTERVGSVAAEQPIRAAQEAAEQAAGVGPELAPQAAAQAAQAPTQAAQQGVGRGGVPMSAQKLAEDAAALGAPKIRVKTARVSQPEFAAQSKEVERFITQETKEPFTFSVGEQTGSPSALTIEKTLEQKVGPQDSVIRAKVDRMEHAKRLLDNVIDRAGGEVEPADAGRAIASGLQGYDQALVKVRSEVARPFFEAAEAAGSKVKMPNTIGFLKGIIDRAELAVSSSARVSGKGAADLLEALGAVRDESGRFIQGGISPKRLQVLLEDAGEAVRGTSELIEGLPSTVNKRHAKGFLRALKADLNEAAESGVAGSSELKEARRIWAQYGEQIQELTLNGVKKILKLDDAVYPDRIPEVMLKESPAQIAAVMRVLGKADGMVGTDSSGAMRRSLLQKAMEISEPEAGLGVQGASISPDKWFGTWRKHGAVLRAAFADDPKALKSLAMFNQATRRFAASSKVRGSDTFQKILANRFVEAASKLPGMRHVAERGATVADQLTSDEAIVRLMTDPEAMRQFVQAANMLAQKKITPNMLDRSTLLMSDALMLIGQTGGQNEGMEQ